MREGHRDEEDEGDGQADPQDTLGPDSVHGVANLGGGDQGSQTRRSSDNPSDEGHVPVVMHQ